MKFHLRGFVSLFLTLAFLVLSVSGVVLFVTPRGRVANWTNWTLLGLNKQTWQAIHIDIAILFLLGALLHLWFNWNVLWCYMKKKASMAVNLKVEMLAAFVLAGTIVVGAIFQPPPFRNVTDLNSRIKDYWDQWAAEAAANAPTPHAEELSLEQLAANLRLPLKDVIESLDQEGIVVEDGSLTLKQLAEINVISPREIYEAIHKHFPNAKQSDQGFGQRRGQHKGQGGGGGRGRGRHLE